MKKNIYNNKKKKIFDAKSERGITLAMLIAYIVLAAIAATTLTTIVSYFSSNMQKFNAQTVYSSEFDKFNLYFLQEVKAENNSITSSTTSTIQFSSGNTFTYSNNAIFFNNIKVAERVERCSFIVAVENGKDVIEVNMRIAGETRTTKYSMDYETTVVATINEEDYIFILPTPTDGSWNSDEGVNSPKLANGMVAVYWATDITGETIAYSGTTAVEIYSKIDEDGNPTSTGTANSNFNWDLWYDYINQAGITDGTSRWANAITDDRKLLGMDTKI